MTEMTFLYTRGDADAEERLGRRPLSRDWKNKAGALIDCSHRWVSLEAAVRSETRSVEEEPRALRGVRAEEDGLRTCSVKTDEI